MVLGVKQDPSTTTTTATTSMKSGADVARSAAAGASKAASSGKYSHNWEQQTVALVQEAHHLAADAGRYVVQAPSTAHHDSLGNSHAVKLESLFIFQPPADGWQARINCTSYCRCLQASQSHQTASAGSPGLQSCHCPSARCLNGNQAASN